jgi:hypothetical protein
VSLSGEELFLAGINIPLDIASFEFQLYQSVVSLAGDVCCVQNFVRLQAVEFPELEVRVSIFLPGCKH